jgi:hypothetical protein
LGRMGDPASLIYVGLRNEKVAARLSLQPHLAKEWGWKWILMILSSWKKDQGKKQQG